MDPVGRASIRRWKAGSQHRPGSFTTDAQADGGLRYRGVPKRGARGVSNSEFSALEPRGRTDDGESLGAVLPGPAALLQFRMLGETENVSIGILEPSHLRAGGRGPNAKFVLFHLRKTLEAHSGIL